MLMIQSFAAGYPVLVVVNGSKGMPPFGALLDDEQVAAVVNYVRSHSAIHTRTAHTQLGPGAPVRQWQGDG
jgi:mono/diheme cytochrome c family protein